MLHKAMETAPAGAIKPKQLRKVTDGRLFNYSDHLAKRKDMVPVWPKGVDPNYPDSTGGALSVSAEAFERADQLQHAIKERDAIISKAGVHIENLENQIESLKAELQKANAQIQTMLDRQKMTSQENGNPPGPDTGVPDEEMTAEQRQNVINAAVAAIIEEKNKDDFTGGGLPRIGSVEARCGLTDVSAEERDAALKAGKFVTP